MDSTTNICIGELKLKVTGIKVFKFFCEIFFEMGFYLVTGGVFPMVDWKMVGLFVRIKGCGVCGSHLRKKGGRGVVGSAN